MMSFGKVLSIGLSSVLMTACGSTTVSAASSSSAASRPHGNVGRRSFVPPAAVGVVAAIKPPQMQVQGTQTGETTVTWTPSTRFTLTVKKPVSVLSVGECVKVQTSAPVSKGVSPSAVAITPLGSRCSSGVFPHKQTRKSGGTRRKGHRIVRSIRGSIKALGTNSIELTTVHVKSSRSKVLNIGITSSTAVIVTEIGDFSDLAVGKCVVVRGSVSSIGTVSAKSILISPSTGGACGAHYQGTGING